MWRFIIWVTILVLWEWVLFVALLVFAEPRTNGGELLLLVLVQEVEVHVEFVLGVLAEELVELLLCVHNPLLY